eukprot:1154713-Lingulodinium_polyedra.AAC.1
MSVSGAGPALSGVAEPVVARGGVCAPPMVTFGVEVPRVSMIDLLLCPHDLNAAGVSLPAGQVA